MLRFLMLGFNPNVWFLFSPFRKSKKKNQWNPLRVIWKQKEKTNFDFMWKNVSLFFVLGEPTQIHFNGKLPCKIGMQNALSLKKELWF